MEGGPTGKSQLTKTMKRKRKTNRPPSPGRLKLQKLSEQAHTARAAGLYVGTINEFVVATYAAETGHPPESFRTIPQLKEEGLRVKKGSKAFMVWGAPRKATDTADTADTADTDTADTADASARYRFWPTCNLFTPDQVEPIAPAPDTAPDTAETSATSPA